MKPVLNYRRKEQSNRDWIGIAIVVGAVLALIGVYLVVVQLHLRGYGVF